MDVKAIGQMGKSIIVETGDGRMAEIKADGTLGATTDSEHFMRNLGGYVRPITDPAAADDALDAVAANPDLIPPKMPTVEAPR